MVRYCVMWKFKPSDGKTSKELAEDVKENYESLLGLVPGLKNIEVGVNRNEGKTSPGRAGLNKVEAEELLFVKSRWYRVLFKRVGT